ncbi:reverse transcriptase domain-containing protein [Tanacetum coccineum]|uniref:Reverse transcriptase domain-containing protein n=1 Tax=Tanacetum coccineum TaxID=301880 RepID=A0ABQ5H565_9ASTR
MSAKCEKIVGKSRKSEKIVGKWVKEKKEKTTGTHSEERKKEEKKPTADKVYVLVISRKKCNVKKRHANHGGIGEITFPPLPNVGSSDPVIIKVYISGRQVNRAYLDGGSSCDVIYEHCFLKLKPSIISLRVDSNTPLVGFSGEQSWPLGEIPLEVTIGEGPIAVTKTLTFIIVKSYSPHNLLLGRTAMQQIGIVVSTVHGAIKFHMPRGIGTIFSEYNSQKPKEEEDGPTNKYQGNEKNVLSCIDTEERMVINDKYPEQKITIGRQLPTRIKIRPLDLLKRYIDVFAWTSAHITGVPRVLMIGGETFNTEHRINMFNHAEPVKQKKRSLASERNEAIHSQVEELTESGILCLQGVSPDPYSRGRRRKTTFFTREGVFYYKRLPFGLKNAGATYQKLIDKVFGHQMGRNMEVNVDDMVIKSDSKEEIMADITETLERLRAINLKLNLKKCSFRVEEGIYLVHLITKQGIRAYPSKVKAVSTLRPPKLVSEMQNLNKKIAALSRGRNSIKGQILADFLVETLLTENKEAKNEEFKREKSEPQNAWKLFTDGASSSDGSGVGLMVVSPEGKEYTYALRFEFKTTNNEAEYEALLAGLRIAKEMEIRRQKDRNTRTNHFCRFSSSSKSSQRKPKQEMKSIMSACPFSQWGIDIVGPLPTALGGARFGRAQVIISDNGKQFVKGTFLVFCKKLGTLQASTSVYHPQANGQAHQTTPKSNNGETPFRLIYGSKAIIPIEISMETKRVQDFDPKENEKRRREDPDILKEKERNGIDKRSPLQTEAGRLL